MTHHTDRHRCPPSTTGGSVVKMVVLLMLTSHLTAASPLRSPSRDRREAETALRKRSIQRLADLLALHSSKQHASTDTVFDSKDTEPYHSGELNLRAKRAPGCKLGTCQMHNLADTLYRIGHTNGKDQSRKANDPQGYGR